MNAESSTFARQATSGKMLPEETEIIGLQFADEAAGCDKAGETPDNAPAVIEPVMQNLASLGFPELMGKEMVAAYLDSKAVCDYIGLRRLLSRLLLMNIVQACWATAVEINSRGSSSVGRATAF